MKSLKELFRIGPGPSSSHTLATYIIGFDVNKLKGLIYNNQAVRKTTYSGVWRSLVSRLVRDQEAMGSSPVTPTIFYESIHLKVSAFFVGLWSRT